MYKILIVEDDETIAREVAGHLESWGMETRIASDFQHVDQTFIRFAPHLVLLDIGLPFYNGFHWCQEIRRISKAPIIFLSSASDNMNIVMAINMGGDDFIAKPFDRNVLNAKVQAMLRRTYDFSTTPDYLEHDGVMLHPADMTVTYQGNQLTLTRNEYRILQVLMEQKGHVVSRETLMRHLWETDCFIDENTLTVNVARLRRKLTGAGVTEEFITTRKGQGYMIG